MYTFVFAIEGGRFAKNYCAYFKEAKLIQSMFDHIKPSEGYVIDRGDPEDEHGRKFHT